MDGTLPRTPLASDGARLVLRIPPELAALASERLTNRLRALAKLVGLDHAIEVG
jgi:exopolyphosphatase/guanosine-5'-triphosphate,3'-diphosphate pyrophosphatase